MPPPAHIVPDTEQLGIPTTPNGLALCKIHHAAYDQNMLGVSPDYRVVINREVLAEVDGPMFAGERSVRPGSLGHRAALEQVRGRGRG